MKPAARRAACILLFLILPAPGLRAADPKPPSNLAGTPVVRLWPAGAVPDKQEGTPKVNTGRRWVSGIYDPWMAVHLPPKEKACGAAVVVCPGGGYAGLAFGHEGIDIGTWLNSLGAAAFVVRYRHRPHRHPVPLGDAQRAVRIVRHRAKEWGVDPSRIGIMGFSAGGHLAATAATHFDDGDPAAKEPVDRAGCRPDFAILIYPVISMQTGVTHGGSRRNLLGPDPDGTLVTLLSNERQVTAQTPPTFLVHARDDRVVIPKNSELFRDACRKAGVPVELHLYEKGGHGFGLGRKGQDSAAWPKACAAWLRSRKLIGKR